MSNSSPAWKNPRDLLVKHKKRKSNRSLILPPVSADDINTESCPPITGKNENNPFKVLSPTLKRIKTDDSLKEFPFDWDDSTANDSFSLTATSKMQEVNTSAMLLRSKSMYTFGEYSLDFSDVSSSFAHPSSISTSAPEVKSSSTLPQDLRLGTKLRITSKVPFPWMKNAKSTGNVLVRMSGEERSQGMDYFLNFSEDSTTSLPTLPSSSTALLEAASFYWQYPALPWINLYPRIDRLLKHMPKQSAPPLAPTMTEVINKQWFDSFYQLYISWKKGDRKSFYVICPSFTVFFNKSKQLQFEVDHTEDSVSCFQLNDGLKHMAIISPTNLGFREYLKSEGVEFELCSYKRRRLSRIKVDDLGLTSDDCSRMSSEIDPNSETKDGSEIDVEKENNETQCQLTSDYEESPTKGTNGVQEWLNDIGVSPRNSLKLKRHKSMTSTVTALQSTSVNPKNLDKDVTSAVIVSGASLQSLFNLLQTSKATRAIAGQHANLPPTLLATKPFLYGQLLSLKKTSQVVKRQGQNPEYVLELDGGPVMHHTIELITKFIHSSNLVEEEPVTVRVNDKTAYDGLNGLDQSQEWHDLRLDKDSYSWSVRP